MWYLWAAIHIYTYIYVWVPSHIHTIIKWSHIMINVSEHTSCLHIAHCTFCLKFVQFFFSWEEIIIILKHVIIYAASWWGLTNIMVCSHLLLHTNSLRCYISLESLRTISASSLYVIMLDRVDSAQALSNIIAQLSYCMNSLTCRYVPSGSTMILPEVN